MGKVIKTTLLIAVLLLLASGCQPSAPSTQPPVVTPTVSQPSTVQPTPSANQTPPSSAPVVTTPPPVIREGITIGKRALDFQLKTLAGDDVSLSGLRGKPILLNFWATWCGPCKIEMPYLQQINDGWKAKGLVVLAVDLGEKPETIQKFMTDLNLSLTVPIDATGQVFTSYGIGALPTTFLIDKDGIIRQKVIGAFPNVETIENELKKIIP